MGSPAARVTDPVLHLVLPPPVPTLPPQLTGGSGSPNVLIGSLPAWRGLSPAQVAQLARAVAAAQYEITKAETETQLATGTTYQTAAEANETKVKIEQADKLGSLIAGFAAVADIHLCATLLPPPVHGPGVVITGSQTVLINGQPACRVGDRLQEGSIIAVNQIVGGFPTVQIGG